MARKEKIWKDVSKEEFYSFIENYPRELQTHSATIFDPIIVSYNDFDLDDKYPESIVAEFLRDVYYNEGNETRDFGYRIVENYKELF